MISSCAVAFEHVVQVVVDVQLRVPLVTMLSNLRQQRGHGDALGRERWRPTAVLLVHVLDDVHLQLPLLFTHGAHLDHLLGHVRCRSPPHKVAINSTKGFTVLLCLARPHAS
jgi:hypothetical protein